MGIFHTLVSVSPLKIYYPSGSNGSINLFKNVVGQMIWRDCVCLKIQYAWLNVNKIISGKIRGSLPWKQIKYCHFLNKARNQNIRMVHVNVVSEAIHHKSTLTELGHRSEWHQSLAHC